MNSIDYITKINEEFERNLCYVGYRILKAPDMTIDNI